ncbi:MAG: hypothetical protein ACNI27_07365 [Desulfovibrio sp.]
MLNKTDEQKAKHDMELMWWALKGDAEAYRFCCDVCFVAHLWDDLIDKDKVRSDEEINAAFAKLFIDIPENEFYQRNFLHLQPIIRQSIFDWLISVKLEEVSGVKGDINLLAQSYTLRIQYNTIITTCAYLIGGYGWQEEVALKLRQDMTFQGGGYDEYFEEIHSLAVKRQNALCGREDGKL